MISSMPFPFSVSGRSEIECPPGARVSMRGMLEGIRLMLAEEGAHEIRLELNRVLFKAGMRSASGLLKPVAEGEIELNQFSNAVVVEHRLALKKLSVLFSLAMAAALVGSQFYRKSPAEGWLFPAIAIVWLLGGSYLGPAFKFRRTLRRVILETARRSKEQPVQVPGPEERSEEPRDEEKPETKDRE